MNEWLKKVIDPVKNLWGKWTAIQKIILSAIVAGAILALVLLASVSSRPVVHSITNIRSPYPGG